MTRRTARFGLVFTSSVALVALLAAPASAQTTVSQPVDEGCLACLATRQSTAAEWNEALAATAKIKAPPSELRAVAARRAATAPDPRTTLERMFDEADRAYGEDLAHLGTLAARVDRYAQAYLASCYDRYLTEPDLTLATRPTGSLALSIPPPQNDAGRLDTRRSPEPRPSDFEQSSGTPVLPWSEYWTPLGVTGGETMVPCEGMWRDITNGSRAIRTALAQIEADARANNVYPGVVRELYEAYGVNRSLR